MRVMRFVRVRPPGERKPYTRREMVPAARKPPEECLPPRAPRPGTTRVSPQTRAQKPPEGGTSSRQNPPPRELRPPNPRRGDFVPPKPYQSHPKGAPSPMGVYGTDGRVRVDVQKLDVPAPRGLRPIKATRRHSCTPRGAPISGGASLATAAQSRENFREIRGWGYLPDG